MPVILAPLLLGFGVVAAFIVLYGLAQSSQAVTGSKQPTEQGGLWGWIKKGIGYTPIGASIELIAQLLGEANKAFRTTVSHWAEAHLKPLTGWFHSLATLSEHTFRAIGDLAESTAHAIAHLTTVVIPREAAKAAAPAHWLARHANTLASRALHEAASAQAEAERLFGRAMRGIDALKRDVTRTIPREIRKVRAAEKALEREIPTGLRTRLKKLERAVTYAALAAVVLRVIARRWPWLFCRNVRTLGKAACGMPYNLLNDLLGLLTDYFLLESMCDVLPIVERGFDVVAAPLVDAITALAPAGCRVPPADWAPMAVPGPYLPTVYGTSSPKVP